MDVDLPLRQLCAVGRLDLPGHPWVSLLGAALNVLPVEDKMEPPRLKIAIVGLAPCRFCDPCPAGAFGLCFTLPLLLFCTTFLAFPLPPFQGVSTLGVGGALPPLAVFLVLALGKEVGSLTLGVLAMG